MSPKVDKLSQTIENLQIFLDKEANTREDLANVSHQLARLNKTLSGQKLTIKIVGQELPLAKAAFTLIDAQKELQGFFQLEFDNMPRIPQQNTLQQSAILKLGHNLENSTNLRQQVELKSNREYSIGRSPESDITFDGKAFQGVSWSHAGILPVVKGDEETQWQIYDRRSTNGTFVNGQQVKNARLLNSGDIITLASPKIGKKIAELAFNVRVKDLDNLIYEKYWDVVDCDLLLLVADSRQQLAPEIKNFIQHLDRTYISQQFFLVDTPDPQQEPKIAQDAESNLSSIANWIKNNVNEQKFELIPLYLKPFYARDYKDRVNPRQLRKQEQFVKTLSNLVKRKPEDILAKRIAAKVIRAVEPVEPFLLHQQQKIAEKLTQEERELELLSQVNLKNSIKNTLAEANQNKERFFKQVKLDLNQSKAALLDGYSKKSISCKIQNFVDGLTPVLSLKNGQKIVRLNDDSRAHSDDINTSLIDFCTNLLQKWATAECYKVSHIYGDGGLQGLLDRLQEQTKIVPEALSESAFSAFEDVNVQEIFTISFAGINCETSYKQKSLATYIMKQFRSQMMQIMMAFTVASGLVGIRLNRSEMIQSFSQYFKQYPWLFGLFIAGIIFLLVSAYKNENELKLDEAGVKLKKDLSSYYQSFSKNLLDKVIQNITSNLELENKRISDGLQVISKASSDRMMEIEQQKIKIKKNIEQYKAQQKSLNTELLELQKLKQM